MSERGATEQEFDEDRQLCDDGNCLGVVADGKCNVCGLATTAPRDPSSGQSGGSAVATTAPRDPASGQTGGSAATNGGADMIAEGGHTDDAFDGDERQLCPDGACTGLLCSDGKCKECGRSAAS